MQRAGLSFSLHSYANPLAIAQQPCLWAEFAFVKAVHAKKDYA